MIPVPSPGGFHDGMKIRVIRLPAQFQECFPAGADKDGWITGASCGIGCCVPRRTRNARAFIKTVMVRVAGRPVVSHHAGHALSYQVAGTTRDMFTSFFTTLRWRYYFVGW